MTTWNIYCERRKVTIKVSKILQKEAEFMIIVDTRDRQHKLSEIDFPSFEWKKIYPGSTIALTISEIVTRWRVNPPKIEKDIKKLIDNAKKKASGLFFIWVCRYCGAAGYVEYEDGDDFQVIADRVVLNHEKAAKVECKKDIHIFDHRGIEQKDSALLISSQFVE